MRTPSFLAGFVLFLVATLLLREAYVGGDLTQTPGIELTLFWMLAAVVIVGFVTKRVRLPYTVALVGAGLFLALLPGAPTVELTPELILSVFLPALVFEAAYNLNYSHLRESIRSISILAIPGVLLTATVVAALVHFGGGLDWTVSFLFGAIVSATDPISVVATFKALGAPVRLRTVLEGESLFNDGTAIVLFNLILGIILAGTFNPLQSVTDFVIVVIGGLALGAVIGYAASFALSRIDDYLIETALTLVVAYGAYFLAEQIHVSGVIAVVAAGLLVGNHGQRIAFSPTSRIAVGLSWELIGFVANSLIFLLVGLQVKIAGLETALGLIVLAVVAVLLSRLVVVLLTGLVVRVLPHERPLPFSWQAVLVWGGLRGAVSLALALSIPVTLGSTGDENSRNTLLAMTFGVILFSLVAQGLTMNPLLMRLGLVGRSDDMQRYEQLQAELGAIRAALNSLEDRARRGTIPPDVVNELRAEYQAREQETGAHLRKLNIANTTMRQVTLLSQRRQLMQVELGALRDLFARGAIDEETLRDLSASIARRLEDEGLETAPEQSEELDELTA